MHILARLSQWFLRARNLFQEVLLYLFSLLALILELGMREIGEQRFTHSHQFLIGLVRVRVLQMDVLGLLFPFIAAIQDVRHDLLVNILRVEARSTIFDWRRVLPWTSLLLNGTLLLHLSWWRQVLGEFTLLQCAILLWCPRFWWIGILHGRSGGLASKWRPHCLASVIVLILFLLPHDPHVLGASVVLVNLCEVVVLHFLVLSAHLAGESAHFLFN